MGGNDISEQDCETRREKRITHFDVKGILYRVSNPSEFCNSCQDRRRFLDGKYCEGETCPESLEREKITRFNISDDTSWYILKESSIEDCKGCKKYSKTLNIDSCIIELELQKDEFAKEVKKIPENPEDK